MAYISYQKTVRCNMQFRKYLIILIVLGLVSCKPISCADFVKKGNRTSSKNKRESFYYNALEADSNCFDADRKSVV